jgi:anaerobic magnesium-protoporphyrin IX monomethyl ester cyclase
MEKYLDAPGGIPEPTAQMIASRGCPFGCIFCAWPQLMYNSRSYRVRKPASVVDEMEYLLKERKFNSVYFDDDTFNINKQNVLGICREIQERGLDAAWAIMARPDTMDEEMLVNLKEAGLCAAKYGVESANQGLLDNINKGMDLKKADRMIRLTKSLGIKIHPTFTFGLPGETPDTIKRTIDYAMSLKADSIQFSILTPYPGTKFYEQLDRKGQIISHNWADYDGASKCVIKTENLEPQDLEKARLTALEAWKRYRRSKRTIVTMPFDKELRLAFANNVKSNGLVRTLNKPCRYIVNI